METPFQISGRTRRKRKNKQVLKGSKEPTRNLSVLSKKIKKKKKCKKLKISKRCLNSLVREIYSQEISLDRNKERGLMEHIPLESSPLEQTINLCDVDNTFESSSTNIEVAPSLEDRTKQTVEIDLIDDIPKQKEVIDLTESGFQPIVIDITDEFSKEEPKTKSDNDEIHVIGIYSKKCKSNKKEENFIPLSGKLGSLGVHDKKSKKKHCNKHSVLNENGCNYDKDNNKNHELPENLTDPKKDLLKIGENIYVNSPVTLPTSGLRPIIIDGSNVAYNAHATCNFSCKRLEICINFFKERGHKVTAFVPHFRIKRKKSDDPMLLWNLEKRGDVILTPSKIIDGKNIVPYDDRYIVQTAVLKGGIIVTKDSYNDLLKENPAWEETIKYRTLSFTWVDDVLMFPKDPLGVLGPTLEEFLKFR